MSEHDDAFWRGFWGGIRRYSLGFVIGLIVYEFLRHML